MEQFDAFKFANARHIQVLQFDGYTREMPHK